MNRIDLYNQIDNLDTFGEFNETPLFGEDLINEMDLIEMESFTNFLNS